MPGGPKKDDDKKERKVNKITKTEAAAKIKDKYQQDSNGLFRLKPGQEGFRDGNGKEIEVLKFDYRHNDWEIYIDKGCKNHTGSLDPVTFEAYKPGVLGRSENL